jgi:hypothetical protein
MKLIKSFFTAKDSIFQRGSDLQNGRKYFQTIQPNEGLISKAYKEQKQLNNQITNNSIKN